MFVRLLSLAASTILGGARHKAILVSCLTLVFALASVVGISIIHDGQPAIGASTSVSNGTSREDTLWFNGRQLERKDQYAAAAETEKTSPQATPSARQEKQPAATPSDPSSAAPTVELAVSTATVTLEQPEKLSASITARLNGSEQTSAWTVSALFAPDGNISVTELDRTNGTITFRIRAGQNATPGTYQVILQAEHTDSNVPKLSKTITVTLSSTQQ